VAGWERSANLLRETPAKLFNELLAHRGLGDARVVPAGYVKSVILAQSYADRGRKALASGALAAYIMAVVPATP